MGYVCWPMTEKMDRIIHNSYEIMVEGRISMRERNGLKVAEHIESETEA